MKIKQFRMHLSHHNQFTAYWNEQAVKNEPKTYDGWFTMDELREKDNRFRLMPEGWEPVVARTYQDHIDIHWPSNPIYFVWCSEIREIEVDENVSA